MTELTRTQQNVLIRAAQYQENMSLCQAKILIGVAKKLNSTNSHSIKTFCFWFAANREPRELVSSSSTRNLFAKWFIFLH